MATLALATAGYGSSSSASSKSGASTLGAATAGTDVSTLLSKLYKGTYSRPPTSAPKARPGMKVWIIPAGFASGVLDDNTASAKKAATKLGWKATVCDGKFDTNAELTCIREAIAAGANGIYTYAIDCANIRSALKEAQTHHVYTVTSESVECNPPLYSWVTRYVEGKFPVWDAAWGGEPAIWIAAKSAGKAKILMMHETSLRTDLIAYQGFLTYLKRYCPGCEIVKTVKYTFAQVGPTLQAATQQALAQHPETTVIYTEAADGPISGAIAPAVRAAGRTKTVVIADDEGAVPGMDLVRKGGFNVVGVGIPPGAEGLAGIDALLRLFAGQRPSAHTGIGTQVWDATHNLPATGGFRSPVPFEALYYKAWGVH